MALTRLFPASADRLAWSRFLHQVRRFCDERGMMEVTTDCLVPAGAIEGTIDSIQVRYRNGSAELHTSPEIEMKRLLADEPVAIYQVCKCFRDDPDTGIHRREFMMLEFYRPGVDYDQMKQDIIALLETLVGRSLTITQLTVRELVLSSTGIDLDQLRDREGLANAICEHQLLTPSTSDSWEDLFFKLMIQYGEPALPTESPILLTDYPMSVSVLSETCADPFWAQRFELYWQGLELCNGCTELTDGIVLRSRLSHENQLRAVENKPPHPLPERLLCALDSGLPPCAGVAVGLDRLFTCLQAQARL